MNDATILLLDDDPVNLAIYEEIIAGIENAHAVAFSDGKAALQWCTLNDPDLLVVDYVMPVMDGITFIENVRQLKAIARTPVVMITAESERSVRHRALEAGANDFLNKPVDRIEMIARIRNLLEIRRSRHALEDRAAWLASEVRKATSEIVGLQREIIFRLARAAEFRDRGTGMHIVRIGAYSALLAKTLGYSDEYCEMLRLAAPMHDVGKVATPDSVLLKPGPLSDDERDVMRQHAMAGYEILKDSKYPLMQLAAELAKTHHERWDGQGYPDGIRGDAIPISGRLVAVCDVFDALVSVRPYKPAWTTEDAVAEIRARTGTHFDPTLADAFLRLIPEILEIRDTYQDSSTFAMEGALAYD